MYNRLLSPFLKKTSKSILLLGPRQVGKSTLIRSLKPDLEINFANEQEFFIFQTELQELERRISASRAKTIFIDEIQRIPRLTNTIQYLIDRNPKLKFYLTGSSARKLRRGKANLLPGRVLSFILPPLCAAEVGPDWSEEEALKFGSLPGILSTKSVAEKKHILSTYSNHYIKEEIMAESLVRKIDGFLRFMNVIVFEAARFVDYTKLASRAKISRQTVTSHFEILEDTLLARRLFNDPHLSDGPADLVKHPRLFFFDLGVLNAMRSSFDLNPERMGFLLEHLVYNQVYASAAAKNRFLEVYNFRTRGNLEVDFIFNIEGDRFAVECKATAEVSSADLRPLLALDNYYSKIKKLVIYRGSRELKDGKIWILPLRKALDVMGLKA